MKLLQLILLSSLLITNAYSCNHLFMTNDQVFKREFIKVSKMTNNKDLQEEANSFKYSYKKDYLQLIEKDFIKKGSNTVTKSECYENNLSKDKCLELGIEYLKGKDKYKIVSVTVFSSRDNKYYQDLLKRYPEHKDVLKLLVNNSYDHNRDLYQKEDTFTFIKTNIIKNLGFIIFFLGSLISLFYFIMGRVGVSGSVFIGTIFLSFIVNFGFTLLFGF